MPQTLLGHAVQFASMNIVLQIAFRISTFILNAVLLRYVSRDVLGIVNVRLTLLYSTVLFLSHEAFRKSCLNPDTLKLWKNNKNLLWLSFPGAILCSFAFGSVWVFLLSVPPKEITSNYSIGVVLTCICCCVEKLAEPMYIAGQALRLVKTKVVIEGLVQVVKVSIFAGLTIFCSASVDPVLGFCFAQLAASSVYFLAYCVVFTRDHRITEGRILGFGDFIPDSSIIHAWKQPNASLTWSFFKQGFMKQLLTEGERYVMTFIPVLSFADQGVFDIVNNLGSLAARFIFLPIEEASHFYFAQSVRRGNESSQVLGKLIRSMMLIGLTIFAFAIPFAEPFLFLYGGAALANSEAPKLLVAHAFYVVFLAINGVTECYSFVCMTKEQLERYNVKLLWISGAFLLASYLLTSWLGSVGFIFANCCNMALRILNSVEVIKKQKLKDNPLDELKPRTVTVALLTIGSFLAYCSKVYIFPRSILIHLLIGASVFLWCIASMGLTTEKDLMLSALGYFFRRHLSGHETKKMQ
ncbi:unnamed protein product [Notodromas monacha]|uniref:Protein RFT1 homolog n=1 Tax=Notodromas monacha TaxID=399045 RepID=A0A7R9GES1_9CRUS|nr:unnamed protein product [Notodromas monacha]CAG0918562.1 unnamed protein product [Notodromas monacha]